MSEDNAGSSVGLVKNRVGKWGIVFFVLAAAAPLTVITGSLPAALLFGGNGFPGAVIAAGLVLILFAAGFTAMSQHINNTGAFYAYVTRGVGRPAGIGVAFVTLVSYVLLSLSFYGLIGFFGNIAVSMVFGVDLPWYFYSLVALGAIVVLSYRKVDVGAKVLGVLLAAEVAIILIVSLVALINGGPEAASLEPFSLNAALLAPGAGILLVFAFGAFIGFEGTAVYSEEAIEPAKTIPRATYIAIIFLAVFYALAAYAFIYAFGFDGTQTFLQTEDFTTFPFAVASTVVGGWAANVMLILIVTSFFACLLAFHNASSRYIFSLGREGLLPQFFGVTREKSGAPLRASYVLIGIALVVILLAIVTGTDPYTGVAIPTYAAGVAGIVFAQGLAGLAVLGFFRKDRRGHSIWRVVVFPALGTVGLISAWVIILFNFDVLTALGPALNALLILPTPVLFVGGLIYAAVLKRRNPERYQHLAGM
jgi:amino acid transporter